MENASDALMMAFGVLIFVLALTVAVNSLSQAREVSEIVLFQADSTNFYEYYDEVTDKGASQERIVGLETVVPTLYKYYKEKYAVLFREGYGYDEDTGDFESYKIMKLYESPEYLGKDLHNWAYSDDEILNGKYKNGTLVKTGIIDKYSKFFKNNKNFITKTKIRDIFLFDVDEEDIRREPWTGSPDEQRNNLDVFLNGGIYYLPSANVPTEYITYPSFIANNANARFVESTSEITREVLSTDANDEIFVDTTRTNKDKKRIYIFTKIMSYKPKEE